MKYAFLGCIFFGISNFISGELGGRLGVPGGYPFFIGNIICWFLYHTVDSIVTKKETGKFWFKENSIYYDLENKSVKWLSFFALLIRGIV